MGAEGGDLSSMDFAIVVAMTEDVIDLMRLDVKCHCHNLIPSLPLGKSSRCTWCGILKGAPQTFPLSLSKAGKQ